MAVGSVRRGDEGTGFGARGGYVKLYIGRVHCGLTNVNGCWVVAFEIVTEREMAGGAGGRMLGW